MKDKRNLTQALIDKATCEGDSYCFVWDKKQEGLGVKIEPSGHKSYVFRYRFEGAEKRRVIASCNKITLDQARERANECAYKITRNIDPFLQEESRPVYEVTLEWLKTRKSGPNKVAPNTYIVWESQVENHIKNKKIGKMPINKVKLPEAVAYMKSFGEAVVTANRMRSLLRLVFKYAIQKGDIITDTPIIINIWDYVEKYEEAPERPRLIEHDDKEKDHPTLFFNYMAKAESGEIKDGKGKEIDPAWRYIIWLLYLTGARPDDICDLRIEEIDFGKCIIRRTRSKTGAKDIPISEEAAAVLRKAIELIPRVSGNPYVFAGKNGKGYRATYAGRQWKNLQKVTGITAPPYALRRYFALIAKREHGNSGIASKLMSHADEKMTEAYAGPDKILLEQERKMLILESEKLSKKLMDKQKLP